jgi:hypothetical protein
LTELVKKLKLDHFSLSEAKIGVERKLTIEICGRLGVEEQRDDLERFLGRN